MAAFAAWLARVRASLAFSTYQVETFFLIRLPIGRLSISERGFPRRMDIGAGPVGTNGSSARASVRSAVCRW